MTALEARRLAVGLTRDELAQAARVSVRTITYAEREGRILRPATRLCLAVALGLHPDDLFPASSEAAPNGGPAEVSDAPLDHAEG